MPLAVNNSGHVLARIDDSVCFGSPRVLVGRYENLITSPGSGPSLVIESGGGGMSGGINALGQAVINFVPAPPFDRPAAYFVRSPVGAPFQGAMLVFEGSANAINNLGEIGGRMAVIGDGTIAPGTYAYRYTGQFGFNGTLNILDTPLTDNLLSEVLAMNSSGQVVGTYADSQLNTRGFLNSPTPWPMGTSVDLGLPPGGFPMMTPRAMNDRGQVAGRTIASFGVARAFRRDVVPGGGSIINDLGSLGGTFAASEAFGITPTGIVVGTSDLPGGSTAPFMYFGTPGVDGFMINLDLWLDDIFPSAGAAWTLLSATAASPNGWIAGQGIFGGVLRAYLLDARFLVPPCQGPAVTLQPSAASVCQGIETTFSFAAANDTFAGVRWEWSLDGGPWRPWTRTITRDGVPIAEVSGGDTRTLRITPSATTPYIGNALRFRAVVATECGIATTVDQPLSVQAIPRILPMPIVRICAEGPAQFDAQVIGTGPFTVQWSVRDPISGAVQPIVEGLNRWPDGRPLFSATEVDSPRLKIRPPDTSGGPRWTFSRLEGILLSVTGPCGVAEAQTELWACIADFDCSSSVTTADIFAFLNGWFAGDPRADLDGNGLTPLDIFEFLNAWFQEC